MIVFRAAAVAVVLSSFVVAPVLAQQRRSDMPIPQVPAVSQNDEIPDAVVHKVGTALRNVTTINKTYEQRAKAAETQQQVQDLDVQTRNEMLKAISDQGLSVQQYRQALQRAQTNSTLRKSLISAAEQSN